MDSSMDRAGSSPLLPTMAPSLMRTGDVALLPARLPARDPPTEGVRVPQFDETPEEVVRDEDEAEAPEGSNEDREVEPVKAVVVVGGDRTSSAFEAGWEEEKEEETVRAVAV